MLNHHSDFDLFRAEERSTKILLIDDDAAVLEVVGLMLASEDHAVVTVSSAREALAHLETEAVDLVLTDLHMPDMDGWQLLRAVRSRWPSIRTGVHSGSFGEVPLTNEPPDLALNKPVRLSDLREGIASVDRRQDAKADHRDSNGPSRETS
jgi:CheY-like chemotaxis protein